MSELISFGDRMTPTPDGGKPSHLGRYGDSRLRLRDSISSSCAVQSSVHLLVRTTNTPDEAC